MDFSAVKEITIPQGSVKKLQINGPTVWEKQGGSPEPSVRLSWEHVLWSIENNRYTADYGIGDLIPLDLGTEGNINMQIAAFDADDRADGNGKAHISFISKELLATSHRMNPTLSGSSGNYTEGTGTIGGWEKSEMRSYIKNTIKPLIPSFVRSVIVDVTKTQDAYNSAGSSFRQTTADDLWLPASAELNGSSAIYASLFTGSSKRKKAKIGGESNMTWNLRDAYTILLFYTVSSSGAIPYASAQLASYAVCLGFCL